ncbi:MAG: cytochrome c oxidase subunit 3 family protein [Caldilineaceae bacterium]|nr:cytochrome c oxidase subunit 3 family protein [Caldilineaceae bacterium]
MTEVNSALGHHFTDLAQQREANTLGMWAFLATEVLFFGGLFTAYLVYRSAYPEVFAAGSEHLKMALGAINTGVLLTSSLTVALAVHAATQRARNRLLLFMALTVVLGLLFLGIKGFEYYQEYQENLVPTINFTWEGNNAPQAMLFFVLYFFMTLLHALHMIIGISVLLVMIFWAWRGWYEEDDMPVERFGLYWHFVDIVWVFLFPLLYLIGR